MRSPRPDSQYLRGMPIKSESVQPQFGDVRPPTPKSHQDSRYHTGGVREPYRRPAPSYPHQHYPRQQSPRPAPELKHAAESSEQKSGASDVVDSLRPNESKRSVARCRLFVGNIPQDMTDSELREMCSKFGSVGEVFVNTQRGFAFVRFERRSIAEEAKDEIDGIVLRGKTLRVRYASHGAAVRVRNLSDFVSNELLYEAFSYFGKVERAVVGVDDRGRSTGEGIVEFDRKPVAQQCIAKCADGCFLLTGELKPVIVEALVQVDEEDGLSERSLIKSDAYYKARSQPPRFVQPGSFEHSICARWIELEDQRRQMEAQLKERMQLAKEQLQLEIEQAMIDHQTFMMREDLVRRQNELRFLEEKRRQELEKRKNMIQLVMQQQQQSAQQFNFPRLPALSLPSMPNPRLGGPTMNPMDNMNTGQQQQQQPYPLLANYLMNPSGGGSLQNMPSSAAQTSTMKTPTSTGVSSNGQSNLMAAASSISALGNTRVVPPGLFTASAFFQNDPSVNPAVPKDCLLPNAKGPQQMPPTCREQPPPMSNSGAMENSRSSYPPQRKRSRF